MVHTGQREVQETTGSNEESGLVSQAALVVV